jgi:hypothetical protein
MQYFCHFLMLYFVLLFFRHLIVVIITSTKYTIIVIGYKRTHLNFIDKNGMHCNSLKEKSLFSCAATSSFCVFRRAISAISLHNKKVPWQWRGRVKKFYWQVRSCYRAHVCKFSSTDGLNRQLQIPFCLLNIMLRPSRLPGVITLIFILQWCYLSIDS